MQQILLSSQNILPNQAKVTSNAPGNQTGNPSFVSLNKGESTVNSLSGNDVKAPLIQGNQGGKESFLNILDGLDLSNGNESMQSASLAEWKKLLNDNPVLLDQLEGNPEIVEQIQTFIDGQTLSQEGEVLPPLLTKEGEKLLSEGPVTSSELKTSDAALTLQQVMDKFLGLQQANELESSSELKLSVVEGVSGAQGSELANVSIPYVLTDQNDANIKAWGRFSSGSQGVSATGGQMTNVTGSQGENPVGSQMANTTSSVNADYSNTLNRGGSSASLMQGAAVNSLQPETDVQFKASFDSFSSMDSEASDLLEPGRTLERSDSSKSQFSEIQSKLQGTGLKQYSMSLETNVQDPEWGDEMGQKIVWLTGRAIQSAEIHLNPADLGPIEVQIKVQNDQAAVTFHAQNSTVRDMLESNVHRLRDMMESNGVDLAEVSVGSEESGSQYSARDGDETGQNGESGSGAESDSAAEASDESLQASSVSNRLVDFYA